MDKPAISVVVPAYNCQKTIASCINAILKQSLPPQEVIVVDDGSQDQSARLIQDFKNVKYVYQPNAGPAAARNTGAFLASGDVVFFTDSDCVPDENWLARAIEGFVEKDVVAVAGSYGIVNQKSLLARVIHQEILFRHHQLMPKFPKAFGSYNVGIKKNVFKEVRGFSTAYRFASGEDNDLSYKIIQSGGKILFNSASLVNHFHTEKPGRYLKEQFRHGFWRAKLYFDHAHMMKGDDYTFWKDIIEVPLVLVFIFSTVAAIFMPIFIIGSWVSGGFLIVLQIFFSLLILKKNNEQIFGAGIFFLRSFARTSGFSTGLITFFLRKSPKKDK